MMPGHPRSPTPTSRATLWRNPWSRAVVLAVTAGLLFFALRRVQAHEIWSALQRLQVWQILLLLAIDALVYACISARWWLIVRAEDRQVDYLALVGVRLAAFGISYFTVGPQVGGEPMQVMYLRRRYGSSFARATAVVLLDKLLELLANFVFLVIGVIALIRAGILAGANQALTAVALLPAALVAWPMIHILMLRRGLYPISALMRYVPGIRQGGRVARYVRASERLAGQFCRRHPRSLLCAIGASLLACLGAVIEYALITSFLGLDLGFWQVVAAWTAGWLSFLIPLPGGLGALETSQVVILGILGISAASAVSVSWVMRGRDILIGGLGLLLAARIVGSHKSKGQIADVETGMEPGSQAGSQDPGERALWDETND